MDLDLYLADSSFNSAELSALLPGGRRCLVVPPFHHAERLLSVSADTSVFSRIPDDSPMILSVGRVAPNKNHGALIDSIGFLNGPCGVPVRLAIVGGIDPAFELYVAGLRARIQRVGLGGRVEFLGKISDAQLKACYQRAQVLVTTSLHEGFCVPVVEAMALGVPIVAHAAGAVGETVGDAGLVWQTIDPELFGVTMRRVLHDAQLHTALVARGEARFRSTYAGEVIADRFVGALQSASIGVSGEGYEGRGL
jgi:glycosyltransferase involved in cell wall biosynthesis